MASQHPSRTGQYGNGSAPRRGRLRLLWPVAAVGLGLMLIQHSLGSPVSEARQQPRPAAVASHGVPSAPPSTLPEATTIPTPSPPFTPAAPSTALRPSTPTTPAAGSLDKGLPRSTPVRISIPEIGVDAPFTKLSLDASKHLSPPPANDKNLVGWFQGGASPGERGAAIVVGHVDTKTGPAVFVDLASLEPGDPVSITRADGVVARFKVDRAEKFSKAAFPDDLVYTDTPTAELRLITCGGTFDRSKQDYEDNLVVFAHLDSIKMT
ncbi:class F sortase [Streptomyces sp. NRRL S-813]|uniref:class F sortase n=1 Tax=Streptomyces sp. NRRL S-813 TaxID=1463919 RepID=UPI0004BF19A9|nr:class F sortase [Streptomyces sp. NRRL S-813]